MKAIEQSFPVLKLAFFSFFSFQVEIEDNLSNFNFVNLKMLHS